MLESVGSETCEGGSALRISCGQGASFALLFPRAMLPMPVRGPEREQGLLFLAISLGAPGCVLCAGREGQRVVFRREAGPLGALNPGARRRYGSAACGEERSRRAARPWRLPDRRGRLRPRQQLRVAWLRLTPELSARERTLRPHLWVSHRSAADLFDLGVTIADVPEFIADRRLQTRAKVKIHLRSDGPKRGEWTVHDGFAVTPARTIADLATDHMDGGHLGRIASDAPARGLTTEAEVEEALGGRADLAAILALATGKVR